MYSERSLLDEIPSGAEPIMLASKNHVEIVLFKYEEEYYIMKQTQNFGFAGKIPKDIINKMKEMFCGHCF